MTTLDDDSPSAPKSNLRRLDFFVNEKDTFLDTKIGFTLSVIYFFIIVIAAAGYFVLTYVTEPGLIIVNEPSLENYQSIRGWNPICECTQSIFPTREVSSVNRLNISLFCENVVDDKFQNKLCSSQNETIRNLYCAATAGLGLEEKNNFNFYLGTCVVFKELERSYINTFMAKYVYTATLIDDSKLLSQLNRTLLLELDSFRQEAEWFPLFLFFYDSLSLPLSGYFMYPEIKSGALYYPTIADQRCVQDPSFNGRCRPIKYLLQTPLWDYDTLTAEGIPRVGVRYRDALDSVIYQQNYKLTVDFAAYFAKCNPAQCQYFNKNDPNKIAQLVLGTIGFTGGFVVIIRNILRKLKYIIGLAVRSYRRRSALHVASSSSDG